MRDQRSLITVIFLIFFISIPVISTSQEDVPEKKDSYDSVEERRIHATIQEERASIIEDKKALVLRENELKTLEAAVDKKIAELDIKLDELKKSKQELSELLEQKDAEELKKIQALSKIYEKMDPGKAALALSGLDQDLAADLLAHMKVKAAAKILDNLNKPKATEISKTFSTIQLE